MKTFDQMWDERPELASLVDKYLAKAIFELGQATPLLNTCDNTAKANKVITLSLQQYDMAQDILHDARDDVGFLLANNKKPVIGTAREELEAEYKLIDNLTMTMHEQTQ